MPRVSVIINCYNGEAFLAETLESIAMQTMADFELIFWDNCSTDRTPEIAKTFDSRLRYYRAEAHTSLGQARNQALQLVKGDYIAFIDSDDLWDKYKLAVQLKYMQEHPDCGLLFTNCEKLNMLNGKTKVVLKKGFCEDIPFSDFICKYMYALSSCMLRTTSVQGMDILFDTRLSYAEEFDLFIRMAYNWKVAYLSQVLVTYRIHRAMTSITLKNQVAFEMEIVLNNLNKSCPGLHEKYPEVVKQLMFASDLLKAKESLSRGENILVRNLIKPYLNISIKAKAYYIISFLPKNISVKLYNLYYHNRFRK